MDNPHDVLAVSCWSRPALLGKLPILAFGVESVSHRARSLCSTTDCEHVSLQAVDATAGDEDGGFIFQPDPTLQEVPYLATHAAAFIGLLPCVSLPPFAQSAIDGVLPFWTSTGMSTRRMRSSPLPEEPLQVISSACALVSSTTMFSGWLHMLTCWAECCRALQGKQTTGIELMSAKAHAEDEYYFTTCTRAFAGGRGFTFRSLFQHGDRIICKHCPPEYAAAQDLLKAAERFQAVLALTNPLHSPPGIDEPAMTALRKDWNARASSPVKAEANGHSSSPAVQDADLQLAAADMAAGWSRAVAAEGGSMALDDYGLAGLAASVLVCGCPRCAAWPL